jgi:hypothetical protein
MDIIMKRVFKWWWAWNYEEIEDWLENMEAEGLRLVETRFSGVDFYFEKCTPTKARYCIDYQDKITPDYMTIIDDDGWKLYKVGAGWYILRKEYEHERPEFYTDFDGLIIRNKKLLSIMIGGLFLEFICFGSLIWNAVNFSNDAVLAGIGLFGTFALAFFTFVITNLALQINKFKTKI